MEKMCVFGHPRAGGGRAGAAGPEPVDERRIDKDPTREKKDLTPYFPSGFLVNERSVVPFASARLSWSPLMVKVVALLRDAR